MSKHFLLMIGPIGTRSGYGDHMRDIFHSLYDMDMFDIKVIDTKWGDTPRNALKQDNPKDKLILDRISKDGSLPKQPDICVDVRIPNEFEKPAKYLNIGFTAGIETNAVSPQWLAACNKMDLIIVPSEHSKSGFVATSYKKNQRDSQGNEVQIGDLKLEVPIEVLFEGVHEDIFKPLTTKEIDTEFFDWLNDEVPEKFAFLFVGLWGNGDFGEDRKDIGTLVKTFYETFMNQKKMPALILKTNGAGYSILDREDVKLKINSIKSQFPTGMKFPNIYILHGELSPVEMNYLYNHPKIKSLISLTHGEGFGRPLLEATMTGLPVIASNWSGQCDFLDKDLSVLLGGNMVTVPKSAVWENVIIPESQWFNVDQNQARSAMKYVFENHFEFQKSAKTVMENNRNMFTHEKMTEKFKSILQKYISNIPKETKIKLPSLPKLKKTTEPSVPKFDGIKLPKLNKQSEVQ